MAHYTLSILNIYIYLFEIMRMCKVQAYVMISNIVINHKVSSASLIMICFVYLHNSFA